MAARIAHTRRVQYPDGRPLARNSTVRRRFRLPDLTEFDGRRVRVGKMEGLESWYTPAKDISSGKVPVELPSRDRDDRGVGGREILSIRNQ
jgi:hypothetical protein